MKVLGRVITALYFFNWIIGFLIAYSLLFPHAPLVEWMRNILNDRV